MVIQVAALAFAAKDWLLPATVAAIVSVALVGLSYRRSLASRKTRLWGAGLKLLGIAALLLCLLEPLWTGERAKPGANLFAVVADNSQSMSLPGATASTTRGEQVRGYLRQEPQNAWRRALAENYEVRNYLADSRLQPSKDFAELNFEGSSTQLVRSLKLLADRSKGQPLAGALVFTDGTAGDLASIGDLKNLPPIYPVVAGGDTPQRDLAVVDTTVSQSAFEDAPVTVVAAVNARGFRDVPLQGRLFKVKPGAAADEKPEVVAELTLTPTQDDERLAFRLQFRPAESGVLIYKFETAALDAKDGGEATRENNSSFIEVDRGSGVRRILYVSGRPSWEYKFLQRAIQGDEQTHLVGLVRIAKREPKFEFRGRAGESSNPLFRGFGNQSAEEIERYDQPVLIRLNTDPDNPNELPAGFPKTAEELFRYQAVIIDDLEAAFFSAEQMTLLQRFVSERGGGFLMLGGAESFGEGGFARTPIGDMLPIYLDRATPHPIAGPLRLAFTREGLLEPWARLRDNEGAERTRLAELPGFDVLNPTGGIKPAASVVATVNDGSKDYPALVTQRFGRGRSAALLVGDLWKAGLGDEALNKDLARTWRQMIRWVVADVPRRVEARAEPDPESGGMKIQVRVRDPKFLPVDNVNLKIEVERGSGGARVQLTAEPSASEPGLYETSFIPRESDGYRVKVSATDEAGVLLGDAATGWSSDFARDEFGDLAPGREALERLATATGGRVVAPEELESFARDLPSKKMPVTEIWSYPIWHTPGLFLFALGCFIGEWGLRRVKGLA